jgi:hypothetical protein
MIAYLHINTKEPSRRSTSHYYDVSYMLMSDRTFKKYSETDEALYLYRSYSLTAIVKTTKYFLYKFSKVS